MVVMTESTLRKKGFVLACGSRRIEFITAGKTWPQSKKNVSTIRKLPDHMSYTQGREGSVSGVRLEIPKAHP